MSEGMQIERQDMVIEGGRNLYSYTFRDADANSMQSESTLEAQLPADAIDKPRDDKP